MPENYTPIMVKNSGAPKKAQATGSSSSFSSGSKSLTIFGSIAAVLLVALLFSA
jgi:hypothetical protein